MLQSWLYIGNCSSWVMFAGGCVKLSSLLLHKCQLQNKIFLKYPDQSDSESWGHLRVGVGDTEGVPACVADPPTSQLSWNARRRPPRPPDSGLCTCGGSGRPQHCLSLLTCCGHHAHQTPPNPYEVP